MKRNSCVRQIFLGLESKRFSSTSPKFYLNSIENRKSFLDDIATTLNIKNPSDWGKVTLRSVYELGGRPLLEKYSKSRLSCLQAIYKVMVL